MISDSWIDQEMMIGRKTIFKIIYLMIFLIIIGLQIYAFFFVIPEQQRLYEECNKKILCEHDILYGDICLGYVNPVQNQSWNWTVS